MNSTPRPTDTDTYLLEIDMALGQIAFLGSGETSLAGGRIFETLAHNIKDPLRIALMETPAGFELNSAQVVGRVGDFMKTRLQNYRPVVDVIPARKKNSAFSPDDPETPAGFELNSAQVVGKVGDFMKTRLQNYKPVVDVIPARKKNSAYSPDDPEVVRPLLYANIIFMGPGSPTYAIRNLKDTLTWDVIRARHRLGATLIFASAATISIGRSEER